MRLSIRHTTRYRYSHPARYTIQYLRVTPRSDDGQRVERWRLTTPGTRTQHMDAFGNIMHVLVVDEMHDEVVIRVEGEVDSLDTAGVMPMHEDPILPLVYLAPTRLTRPDGDVPELAESVRGRVNVDRIDGLHELSRRVAESVSYLSGATNVETPAATALAAGAGVCQDQAHVFVAAARYLGVPTRYVSGYVHVAGDGISEAASHAWAESWVDDLGWVAFDITNFVCANDAHVRVAVGPDYIACAPIRGVRQGGGDEEMEVELDVAALER